MLFSKENVNITPNMEEGKFHQGIPFRGEVNKGAREFTTTLVYRQVTQLEFRAFFPFWPRLGIANTSQNQNWFCTDNSDT